MVSLYLAIHLVYQIAGAVYDFLVALNLSDDLLLHLQRGEGNLECIEKL